MSNYSKWIKYTTSYPNSYWLMEKPFAWEGFDEKLQSKDKSNLHLLNIKNKHQSESIFDNKFCPYCSSILNANSKIHALSPEWKRLDRVICENCGWWVFCFSKNKVYPYESFRNEFHEGALFNFDFEHTDEPINVIRKRIEQKKIDLRSISPKELEILVGSVFRDYFNVKVKYVGGPGDNGIDLLLTEGDIKIAVQVKRREKTDSKETVSTVRDFLGAILLGDCPRGIVVSTADKFTKPAQKSSHSPQLKRHGIEIDLYNHDMILDLLEKTKLPERPWEMIERIQHHISYYGRV